MDAEHDPHGELAKQIERLARPFTLIEILVRTTLHMDTREIDQTMWAITVICRHQIELARMIGTAVEQLEAKPRPLREAPSAPDDSTAADPTPPGTPAPTRHLYARPPATPLGAT